MELDRKIVRERLEDLMKNPLVKELWTTEPENFDDPTYHPTLRLVIDANDIFLVNLDEFEKLYSDEEANYWNNIIPEDARYFDPKQTGIRNLTCVYRDGRWLNAY